MHDMHMLLLMLLLMLLPLTRHSVYPVIAEAAELPQPLGFKLQYGGDSP